ncbi:hypothetical protein B0H11DRAFT_2056498 [Mycena galericulata]|nr:hypothetical protein B0H11DRAFT_2056498 [Mycena galericulata]
MRTFSQELIDLVLDYVAEPEEEIKRKAWESSGNLNSDTEEEDSERSISEEEANRERCGVTGIAACGLVCRQWLPRSRFHVFANMKLDGYRLKILFNIAGESSLRHISSVRRMALRFDGAPFDPEHLAKLRHCLSLTCVRIYTANLGEEDDDLRLFLGTHLPFLGSHCVSLTRFELFPGQEVMSLRTIADILTCLPALEAFKLGEDSTLIQEDVPASHSVPARLQTLEVTVDGGLDLLFALFLSRAVPPHLKTLVLREWDHTMSQSFQVYSRKAGSGFRSLTLWHEEEDEGALLGILKHTTTLRHLELESEGGPSLLPLISTLSGSTSSLRTLTILSRRHLRQLDYALLDQALAHPRLRCLKKFSLKMFNIFSREYGSLLSPAVKALMPLANSRGILD